MGKIHVSSIFSSLAILLSALFCSIGKAQVSNYSYTNSLAGATLIYSNGFDGAAVNISNTPPDYAVSLFGGSNNAVWLDALGTADTNAFYANGSVGTAEGDSVVLPFRPQTNHVYTFVASVSFAGNPGSWVGAGFAQNYAIYTLGHARFSDSVAGYDWAILTESSGNLQWFVGSGGNGQLISQNGFFTAGPGTHTMKLILDTTRLPWVIACFVDGVQAGTNDAAYASAETLSAVGITQTTQTTPADIHWNSLSLSANQLLILQQPASESANQGSSWTNTVVAGGSQPFFYQWYTNGVPLANATNASLIIPNVSTANAETNYYVVVTNAYGAVTSSPASLMVYAAPSFTSLLPIAYANLITLFGGTNVEGTNYPGSSPTFSVIAAGAAPIHYQWLTNGVAMGGATNTGLTFTNCPLSSPTNFTCIATNSAGAATNTWSVIYTQAPMASFPQAVLALDPIGYWRLNEPDCCGGETGPNDGSICHDYAGGNDGIYTNMSLGWPGYNPTNDPLETSVQFGEVDENGDNGDSDANSIAGINFATNTSAAFTVEAWVAGYAQSYDAGIITLGWGGGGEQFDLDTGANDPAHDLRFFARDAAGALHTINTSISLLSSIGSTSITPWYEVVGVVDEISNQTLSLYVDGSLVGTTPIASGSGIWTATNAALGQPSLMSIGSRMGAQTGNYNYQFYGNINDVAVFNYALTPAQVASLYQVPGNAVAPYFLPPLPVTNFVVTATNTTLTISAIAFGSPPIGYYWTNLNVGTVIGSGATNVAADLNATLTWSGLTTNSWGDALELVVTNSGGSTNWFVTLSAPPPPPIALSYTNPILYSNGFNGEAVTIGGTPATAANSLVGGTNTTWTDALGTNDTGAMLANGYDASTAPDSWILPFTPHAGYVYTLTASLTFSGNPGNWVGLGFAQRVPLNAAVGYGRFSDGGSTPPQDGPNGYDWIILTESSGNVQDFAGAGGANQLISQNSFFTAGAGTHTVQVVLDTTSNQWVMSCYVDGVQAGTNYPYPANPPIGAVGITQNTLTTPGDLQWNYLTLSQVAPGGVPPYLLAPLPQTNTVIQPGMPLTIPAAAFGSGPLGYYWTDVNAGTNVAAGATNVMAPLSASITVPNVPASWNNDQLELTVTNAYGSTDFYVNLNVVTNYTATVNPGSILVTNFQGWGTSLQWWANVVGGYPNRTNYINLIFNTLKLNVVRYEIGAGQNPSVDNPNTPYKAMMQGFELTNGLWNWNADPNQRWVLQQAEANGANLVEAFAVSAPWWMCVSSNVDGNMSGTNNLQTDCETNFAIYLATVVSNLTALDGDHFNYVIPMNEPSLGTVGQETNGYETCHMSNDQQQRVIADLYTQLTNDAIPTGIDGPGDYDEYEAYNDLTEYSAGTLSDLSLFSTHSYIQNDPANLRAEAASQKKPLWVAEYGDSDSTGLTMAQHIHDDITGMDLQAWVYWMAVNSDAGNAFLYNGLAGPGDPGYSTSYLTYEKFYAMGQFSEFVRPGCEIISVNDPYTLAAYNPTNLSLVLVVVNTNSSGFSVTYNLSDFGSAPWQQVAASQTSPNGDMMALPTTTISNQQFTSVIPAQSVTTFVLTPPPAGLMFTNGTSGKVLTWNYGVLQTATNVTGPYLDLSNIPPPYAVPITNRQQFFRIREN